LDIVRGIADRLHEPIAEPIDFQGIDVTVGASIGVVLSPSTGDVTTDARRCYAWPTTRCMTPSAPAAG
jgi:GGDEF domain-containing protein